jgi:hypothetical protein
MIAREGTVGVLAKTVSALQESLNGACNQMMRNLSDSVQTMSTMNMMMEDFVQHSLRIGMMNPSHPALR